MIGWLKGRVLAAEADGNLLLDVGGVGYELMTPVGTVGRASKDGEQVVLHVHTHVREDSLELFGFESQLERRVFRMLIGVPNVGPKTALGVLSALPPPELAAAVQGSDVNRLTKVPGIGKKSAERLVLELKEKLLGLNRAGEPREARRQLDDKERLLSALTHMGYRSAEAERAVLALESQIGKLPLAELLKKALAELA